MLGNVNGWRRESLERSEETLLGQPNFASIKSRISKLYETNGIESDWRAFSPKRHDQVWTSSCVSQAMLRAVENKRIQRFFNEARLRGTSIADAMVFAQANHVPLSVLALYYLCRERMSAEETAKDDGTWVSTAAEILTDFGICRSEQDTNREDDRAFWPWDPDDLLFKNPTWAAIKEAALHRTDSWARITSRGNDRVDDVIMNLAVGNLVVFGTAVDDQWDGGKNVIGPATGIIRGRHATALCGWRNEGFFWDENSWGTGWGYDGFGMISPELVASDLSDDFIVIFNGYEEFLK